MTKVGEREEIYRRAEEALETGDTDRVLELVEEWAHERPPDLDACALAGLALFYAGEYAESEPYLALAHEADRDDPEVRAALGVALFYGCRADEAERHLRAALDTEPEWGVAHHWLARVLDWSAGDDAARRLEAERHFTLAHRADAETFPLPQRLDDDEFRRVLQEAMDQLPERIAHAAAEVAVVVEPYPAPQLLEDAGAEIAPDLLGLYSGVPLPERSHLDSGRPPDVIHVFQRNLELATRDADELRDEIRITLMHELGHYLGLDEVELHGLGLE